MPHIVVYGCDMKRNIEQLTIHADIQFSHQYFYSAKWGDKQRELKEKMEKLIEEYFSDYECDEYTNHEYNKRAKF